METRTPTDADLMVIAIDGPAGSGKSTVARRLADALDLEYLDTGAMYRSVTHAVLRRRVDPGDEARVADVARETTIDLSPDGTVTVDGADVTTQIRSPEVSAVVSEVAANSEVRAELVARQREWTRKRGGGVLEGRDIGTVVFPDARLKVYLTAAPETRAARRARDEKTNDASSVQAELDRRDRYDSERIHDPLRRAEGAFVLDTTDLTVDEVVARLVEETMAEPAPPSERRPSEARPREGRTRTGDRTSTVRSGRVTGPAGPSRGAPTPGADPEVSLELTGAPLLAYRAIRGLLRAVSVVWFRLDVVGREHLPANGGYVLAPGGHRSIIDTPMVSLAGPRVLRYMGAENYFKIPVLGWFLRAMGGFPVERAATDRTALRLAEWVLRNGEPLAVFPESTRQEGPIIQPLKEGAAFLACRAQVPIVPVGIGGAERAMPRGANWARPRKMALVIGEPIHPVARPDGARVKRSDIRRLTEQLGDDLQRLFDEAQVRAGV